MSVTSEDEEASVRGGERQEEVGGTRMSSCWMEHCSTSEYVTYTVPTASISSEQASGDDSLDQEEYAVSTTTFMPPASSSKGFLLARLVHNARTLELRWINTTHDSLDGPFDDIDSASPNQLMPVRLVLPAKIVPDPAISLLPDGRTIQVCAVTVEGYLHVLTFSSPHFFHAQNCFDDSDDWNREYLVSGLQGKQPTLVHAVDSSRFIVACSDGTAICVTIAGSSLDEIELKSNSSFSVRSLIPSFSTRNISDLSSTSSLNPSELVSIAADASSDENNNSSSSFAIGVSRDRKLKIWNIINGTCLKVTDLPVSAPASKALVLRSKDDTSSANTGHGVASGTVPLVKLFKSHDEVDDYSSYLVIFSPAHNGSPSTFFVYGVITGSAGAVNELTPICERQCAAQGQLVDFQVAFIEPNGDAHWCLYALWDEGGETLMQYARLPELESDDEAEDVWYTVDKGATTTGQWIAAYFDTALGGSDLGVSETFIEHLLYPGRYSPSTLDYALAEYEAILTREGHASAALEQEHDSIPERMAAIVGCTVQLEVSPDTDAFDYDDYRKRLQLEWLRFVSLVNQSRRTALQATSLAVCAQRRVVLVFARDAVMSPTLRDDAELAYSTADIVARQGSPSIPAALRKYPGVSQLLECVALVGSALDFATFKAFEDATLEIVRRPFTDDPDRVALDLYDRLLEESLDDEDLEESVRDLLSGSFDLVGSCSAFRRMLAFLPAFSDSTAQCSPLEAGLAADALALSIRARYNLSLGYLALLIYLAAEHNDRFNESNKHLAEAFAIFRTTSSLEWIAKQSAVPVLPPSASLADAFSGMSFGQTADDSATPPFSILHALARAGSAARGESTPLAIASAVSDVLRSTRLLDLTDEHGHAHEDDRTQEAALALRLYKYGLSDVAFRFSEFFPRTSAICYVQGLSLLSLGRTQEAEGVLVKASGAFDNESNMQGLVTVLPDDVRTQAAFFEHLSTLFAEQGVETAVVRFSRLAIDAAASTSDIDPAAIRRVWVRLFRSHLALGQYDDAFQTMLRVPNDEARTSCLGQLVSSVAQDGQSPLLARWPFGSLRLELERTLSFRARNADPFASPNYYDVLFGYHASRGDHRSAALAMLQQARKIAQLHSTYDFHVLLTAQCQSYLSCLNSLSLVSERDAWLALPAESSTNGRPNKRRRVMYYLPDEEFTSNGPKADVHTLEDIRREYTLSLARLSLADDFAELQRSNFVLDDESAVALYMRTNQVDSAFATAEVLGVDMSSLFEGLVDKCAELAAPGAPGETEWILRVEESSLWDSSLASKGWLFLRKRLEHYDDPRAPVYHDVVLERMVQKNQSSVPSWLVDFYLSRNPQKLVSTAIRFDRLDDAFAQCVSVLRDDKARTLVPYSCIDQLLQLSTDEDTASLSADDIKNRQKELRTLVEAHLDKVDKAHGLRTAYVGR